MEYDGLGNLTRYANLGVDGRPVAGRYGIAEAKLRYDQHGNITELAYFGADGQLVTRQKWELPGVRLRNQDMPAKLLFGPDRQLVRGSPEFRQAEAGLG